MQGTATVRQATIANFEDALELLERFFAEEGFHTPPQQIRTQLAKLLDDEKSAVFLTWVDDRAVGVATVTTTSGLELGLSAELEDLYVVPETRGIGIGSALIEAAKRWCRSQGCWIVSVVVTPEGEKAHNLLAYYRSRGFRDTGRTLLFSHLE